MFSCVLKHSTACNKRNANQRSNTALPPHTAMLVSEWSAMDDIIYTPDVLKIGMVYILQTSCSHNKSMHNLEIFINNLVYEKKKIILNENGLSVSSSIFIPYALLPETVLRVMHELIASSLERSVFKKNDMVHICFDIPAHPSKNALGVVNVVCGLLLAINEANALKTHQKTHQKTTDNKICIFDVILRSIFFKHRIDYATVLGHCIRLGYTTTTTSTDTLLTSDGCTTPLA